MLCLLVSQCSVGRSSSVFYFFFFNDTATTEIYTLSLHDALPIFEHVRRRTEHINCQRILAVFFIDRTDVRSEEHTSELQSPDHLVCRLLLEKKKKQPEEPLML